MLLIDDKHDDLPNSMVISQFANEKKQVNLSIPGW